MKVKKAVCYLVLAAIVIYAFNYWSGLPYCNIEYLDGLTVKGKLNPVVYVITKVIAQRKDLKGNDPYKMYVYIHDPDGLASVTLTVNGKSVPATIEDPKTFKAKLNGNTEFGLHHYHVTATDTKGNTASSSSYIRVSNIGAGFF